MHTERDIGRILRESKTVAVVGLSSNPERASYQVARYLQEHGYRIIPINPTVDEVLGERSYASMTDVPYPVDVVDVFRRAEELGSIVDEAVANGAKVLWLQLGIVSEKAAQMARDVGLEVVMDRCMKQDHRKLDADG
ncbi:MAG: CoA-binding protein [Chloroflexota bacterium]